MPLVTKAPSRLALRLSALVLLAATWRPLEAAAQHEHMDIYSTEPGGGSLVLDWDFDKRVATFPVFCAAGLCLSSTINPAFMAPDIGADERGLYRIADGVSVSVEVLDAESVVTLNVDGARLRKPGDSARLGTMPPIHNHPSWQIVAPQGQQGEYTISYKLKADSLYSESPVYTSTVSNLPQVVPTPCPASPCPGDCGGDGEPTDAEVAEGVAAALAGSGVGACISMDRNGDGVLTADEIVAAVSVNQAGCPEPLPPTLADIQETLFTPGCAIPTCHTAAANSGSLVLEAGASHDELVGVDPDVASAKDAGLLRVTAGNPDQSFLYQKLVGPRPEWGGRMPLNGPCLPPERIDQVRRWIAAGALP